MSEKYKPNVRLGRAFKRFSGTQAGSQCKSNVLGLTSNQAWERGAGQEFINEHLERGQVLLAVFAHAKNTAAIIIDSKEAFSHCYSEIGVENFTLYTVPRDFCAEVELVLAA